MRKKRQHCAVEWPEKVHEADTARHTAQHTTASFGDVVTRGLTTVVSRTQHSKEYRARSRGRTHVAVMRLGAQGAPHAAGHFCQVTSKTWITHVQPHAECGRTQRS